MSAQNVTAPKRIVGVCGAPDSVTSERPSHASRGALRILGSARRPSPRLLPQHSLASSPTDRTDRLRLCTRPATTGRPVRIWDDGSRIDHNLRSPLDLRGTLGIRGPGERAGPPPAGPRASGRATRRASCRGTGVRAAPVDASSTTAAAVSASVRQPPWALGGSVRSVGVSEVDTSMTMDPGRAPTRGIRWPKRQGGAPCRFW